MKSTSLTMLLGVGLIVLLGSVTTLAAKEQASQQSSQVLTTEVRSVPVYKPPLRGAPASRVGGQAGVQQKAR